MSRPLTLFANLFLLFLLPSSSLALTIDDFEAGPFTVSTSTFAGQSVSATNVVGGSREVRAFNGGHPASATLALTGADDSLDIALGPQPAAGSAGIFIVYDGLNDGAPGSDQLGANLSALDRLVLRFPSAPSTSANVLLSARVFDSPITTSSSLTTSVPLVAGNLVLLFSDFSNPALFAGAIGQIDFSLQIFDSTGATSSFSISQIQALPEPTTALLLAGGLAAAGLASRRSRNSPS